MTQYETWLAASGPLCAEYDAWLGANQLPSMCADELFCELCAVRDGEKSAFIADDYPVAQTQIEWVRAFMQRWEELELEHWK